MRVLYGINGTGNGHIIKSTNIIKNLRDRGVEVDILISGKNYQINIDCEVKYKFDGVSFVYNKSGSVDYLKTALNINPIKLVKDLKLDVKSYDKVITDFEPITAWSCKLSGKDCIGVSHQYAFLSDKSPRPKNKSWVGELVLNKLSPVTHPIGLHFEKYDDFILHPVIREDVTIYHSNLGHYTVYLPSYDIKNLVDFLSKYPHKFEIFAKVNFPIVINNVYIYPNSQSKFRNSFIRSKGIITSGGFETPSEALYLGKKLMCIPIRGQYEQMCNVEALSRMGVYVGKGLNDIDGFFEYNNKIDYNWENPMSKIINTIV